MITDFLAGRTQPSQHWKSQCIADPWLPPVRFSLGHLVRPRETPTKNSKNTEVLSGPDHSCHPVLCQQSPGPVFTWFPPSTPLSPNCQSPPHPQFQFKTSFPCCNCWDWSSQASRHAWINHTMRCLPFQSAANSNVLHWQGASQASGLQWVRVPSEPN